VKNLLLRLFEPKEVTSARKNAWEAQKAAAILGVTGALMIFILSPLMLWYGLAKTELHPGYVIAASGGLILLGMLRRHQAKNQRDMAEIWYASGVRAFEQARAARRRKR
jgi:hypothetical protein